MMREEDFETGFYFGVFVATLIAFATWGMAAMFR
jgi:hypothetical protein